MQNRLLFDPAQFFQAASATSSPGPLASFAHGFLSNLSMVQSAKRTKPLGSVGGASESFQKSKVSTEAPKPALKAPGQSKPDSSPTKTKPALQEFGASQRQRKPTAGMFGGCGRRPDGTYG